MLEPSDGNHWMNSSRSNSDIKETLELKKEFIEQHLNDTSEYSVNQQQVDLLLAELDRVRADLLEIELNDYYKKLQQQSKEDDEYQ